ncbi:MAG TPA: carbon-nitrogen hydrolase family protein, partial [Thermoplasmata archaeon]|nr:carbon-nitrogen hydrolase family protein [Thermoplasmata archaeon]
MHVLLAQLAPRRGDLPANLDRLTQVVRAHPADLYVFPELFLFGYAPGDRVHRLAVSPGDPTATRLTRLASERHSAILVGGPWGSEERPGEIHNAALLAGSDGSLQVQVKRYLPNFGPFEEATIYTPTDTSSPLALGPHRLGVQICYDAYFPEVSRELALRAAVVLVVLSAAPVTSRSLFEKVLPARAVENACPLVYVNRVGVEDGIVFGGGSHAWDSRGELLPSESLPLPGGAPEERLDRVEIDLD